jgi:hypothetical protein
MRTHKHGVLLLPDQQRQKNKRLGETIGIVVFNLFNFPIPSKYKIITGEEVATAMVNVAKKGKLGISVYYCKEMNNL